MTPASRSGLSHWLTAPRRVAAPPPDHPSRQSSTRSPVVRWLVMHVSPLDLSVKLRLRPNSKQVGRGYLGWCSFRDDRDRRPRCRGTTRQAFLLRRPGSAVWLELALPLDQRRAAQVTHAPELSTVQGTHCAERRCVGARSASLVVRSRHVTTGRKQQPTGEKYRGRP